jgi:predicted nucleic acid-binding protein
MVDRLGLLNSLFSRVVVSGQVHQEILRGGSAAIGVSTYAQISWIEHRNLSEPIDDLLTSVLDKGEASVIQLAKELGAGLVLIDERKGRKIARAVYELAVIGTAGILVLAKRRGLITGVGGTLREMRDCGYWIHDDIVVAAKRAAGET